jgi:hypothetical protein
MSFIGKAFGKLTGADAAARGAEAAAQTQGRAAEMGIDEQRRQFDALVKMMQPFLSLGTDAVGGVRDLAGLGGAEAQQAAISGIQSSPAFTSLLQQGENSILANASATGGLRGGNTQGALAQFSPALLAQSINDQYSRLGGLVSLGQNSAAGVGSAGLQVGGNIANLLQQQGAATAGGQLARGNVARTGFGDLLKIGSAVGGYF